MSIISPTVTIPARRVHRTKSEANVTIYIVQQLNMGEWVKVSEVYRHSTSAFAALGRLTQKDTKHLLDEGRDQ